MLIDPQFSADLCTSTKKILNEKLHFCVHCVKSTRIQSFSGRYFPAFGMNTDHKNSEYEHFSRNASNI